MTKETLTFTAKLKELKAENTKLKLEAEGANQTACNFQELAIKHEWEKNEAVRLKRKYYEKVKRLKDEIEWYEHRIDAHEKLREILIEETKTLKEERTYRHIALAISITFNLVIGFAALAFIIDKYI